MRPAAMPWVVMVIISIPFVTLCLGKGETRKAILVISKPRMVRCRREGAISHFFSSRKAKT